MTARRMSFAAKHRLPPPLRDEGRVYVAMPERRRHGSAMWGALQRVPKFLAREVPGDAAMPLQLHLPNLQVAQERDPFPDVPKESAHVADVGRSRNPFGDRRVAQ